jgi:hypothetical protein
MLEMFIFREDVFFIDNSIVNNAYYGFWYYDDCTEFHRYICERDFSLSTAIPPTTPIPPGNCESGNNLENFGVRYLEIN